MTLQKLITTAYTPLYIRPILNSIKHCDLLESTIVFSNNPDALTDDFWLEILYITNLKTYVGWVPSYYVDPYFDSADHDIIKIKNATLDNNDFSQNIIYKGNVQYNLCGEFSVLYCAGWREFDIESWLDEWQIKSPSYFNRIFYGGKSRTTGISDLTNMLQSFENSLNSYRLISDVFKVNGRTIFTQARLQKVLQDNFIIIGCKIESRFGNLRTSGIPHWIVLDSCEPEERTGIVKVYNPAWNSVRKLDWESVTTSVTKNPYGILIPR